MGKKYILFRQSAQDGNNAIVVGHCKGIMETGLRLNSSKNLSQLGDCCFSYLKDREIATGNAKHCQTVDHCVVSGGFFLFKYMSVSSSLFRYCRS